jgi:hypothetical protein
LMYGGLLCMYVFICQCMYGIGQSGGWNQSEIGFWKSFFHFLISFFNWPFWRASTTIHPR